MCVFSSIASVSGWATINFNDFHSENSRLSTGPLTLEESSLVISLINIGGLIGNFVAVPISQMIGIKRTIHSLGLPLIVRNLFVFNQYTIFGNKKNRHFISIKIWFIQASSLLIIWAQNVYFLYASRLLVGIVNGGLIIGVPALVNDISNDK